MARRIVIFLAGLIVAGCSAKTGMQEFAANLRNHAGDAHSAKAVERAPREIPDGGGADAASHPAGTAPEAPNPTSQADLDAQAAAQQAAATSAAYSAAYAAAYQAAVSQSSSAAAAASPPPPN
jgi:hypothetical protein